MIITIETRLRLTEKQVSELDACAASWSSAYRQAWVLWNNQKKKETEIYKTLMSTGKFTSYQVGSMIGKVKGEHQKFKALTKTQVTQQKEKLKQIQAFVSKEKIKLEQLKSQLTKFKAAKSLNYLSISRTVESLKKKERLLQHKAIKIRKIERSIRVLESRIKQNTFKLCFGSSTLLKQRPGSSSQIKFAHLESQKPYTDLAEWKADWDLARNNLFYSVGRAAKSEGNGEIQYNILNKSLRVRLTEEVANHRLIKMAKERHIPFSDINKKMIYSPLRMQSRFEVIQMVSFCPKYELKLAQAQVNKQPISAKIIKKKTPGGKEVGYYLQLSFEEKQAVSTPQKSDLTMGIDLNQKGLAYSLVKLDGNKLKSTLNSHKSVGFVQWDLEGKTSEQREWNMSNAITQVLKIVQDCNIKTIAIENLDFSDAASKMKAGYKNNSKYNHMLSRFPTAQFKEMIQRKTERLGLALAFVNPVFSSVGGFAKYGMVNKVPVDIAASIWLARQAILGVSYKKENHIKWFKKSNERVSLPYHNPLKQRKKAIRDEQKWSEMSLTLGRDRSQWAKALWGSSRLRNVENTQLFQDIPF